MRLKITLLLLVFTGLSYAQQGINYKAVIKDDLGSVIANEPVTLQFSILKGVAQSNEYTETHPSMTDANGIVVVNIGEGTPVSGNFSTLDWGSDEHFLEVRVDTGGGLTLMGTTQFMAVPYALHAESAANAATKINELTDGKSDEDGTENGSSIFLGIQSGRLDDGTNNANVGIGFKVLYDNTTGHDNTSIGHLSLYGNTEGRDNTALGKGSLNRNTTAPNNTAIGSSVLSFNTIGFSNTAVGFWSMNGNVSGDQNSVLGESALFRNVDGNDNTALGVASGFYVNGHRNVFLGKFSGAGTIEHNKSDGIFIGYEAGRNEENSNRLYIENSSSATPLIYGEFDTDLLRINGTLDINDAYQFPLVDGIANQSLKTNGTGSLSWQTIKAPTGLERITENGGFGWRLTFHNNFPDNYGPIGFEAVDFSYSDNNSTTRGATGSYSTALNFFTTASGTKSIAMGNFTEASGDSATSMGFGTSALGENSTAMGEHTIAQSYAETVVGRYNTNYTPDNTNGPGAENWNPLDRLFVIGNGSISFERNALTVLKNGTITAPSFDLAEITDDRALITKEYFEANNMPSIWIENGSEVTYENVDVRNNQVQINTQIIEATASSLRFGSTSGFNIGIFSGGTELGVVTNGSAQLGSSGFRWDEIWSNNALNTTSDKRLKKDIKTINYGLDEILKLKPVSFKWKQGNSNSKLGFLAQDVEQVIPEIVSHNIISKEKKAQYQLEGRKAPSDDVYAMSYSELIPVLVKAIQEQQETIETLKARIEDLENN